MVFDRVEATRPDFRRHFFLHVPTKPEVNGNLLSWLSLPEADGDSTVLSHGRSRMFMRTLLPAPAEIGVRGGPGQEAWGHPLEKTAQYNHVAEGRSKPPICPWRIEVSGPGNGARTLFLHVFEITDETNLAPAELTFAAPAGWILARAGGCASTLLVRWAEQWATRAWQPASTLQHSTRRKPTAIGDHCSPPEEAVGVIPLRRLGEVEAVEPAADGRVLDRLEAHIGQPELAGAGEPDLELGAFGRCVLGLEDERVRLPFRLWARCSGSRTATASWPYSAPSRRCPWWSDPRLGFAATSDTTGHRGWASRVGRS